MLFYDLETSFSNKRENSLIIEIGATKGDKTFHRLVNPLRGRTLREALQGQSIPKTMRWWRKLLREKGYDVLSMEDIEGLLHTFTPQGEAVRELMEFAGETTWTAHNGSAFDHKIIRPALDLERLPHPKFDDSLHMIRRKFDFHKNSLGFLYQIFFEEGFRAHHALDDAVALQRVVRECARRKGMSVDELFVRDVPVDSIRGIGKATKAKLAKVGIHTAEDLLSWVKRNDAEVWREEMSHLHRYMKLGKRLYGKRW